MNDGLVEQVVRAVLYEGYILYPYRPSVKNRQRWTFGGLFPKVYSEAQKGADPWVIQTECLVEGDGQTTAGVRVRFLHLTQRVVGSLASPLPELPEGEEPEFQVVESLRVGERLLQSWQEAVEREVGVSAASLDELAIRPRREDFTFGSRREMEGVRDPAGAVVAVLVRRQQSVAGTVELSAARAADGLFKVTVRVLNLTPLEGAGLLSRDEAQVASLASTHAILSAGGGALVSLTDPPEAWRETAADCRNVGAWPVLVGEEGDRSTMLASPIILADYPRVAPESPGDLFDATEIDEILTLRILTMTEEEKRAAASVDAKARDLLDRTEALAREQLMRLHATLRRP